MAVRRMRTDLGNICRSELKLMKAFGKLIRVIGMSCPETDVEKEVKATIPCDDPNITNADTLPSV